MLRAETFALQTAPGPSLAAIICTYDRYAVLPAAIASLQAQTLSPERLEIIVIDNSPDRQAAAAFAMRYQGIANLRYQFAPGPGLSAARNQATALAQAPLIAFLDDDAVAAPGWAAALCEAFAQFGPATGAVGGPARPLWLGPRPPWLTDNLLGHLSILDHGPRPKILPPGDTILGCNMAFDRELLLQLGGFSPQLGRLGPDFLLRSNGEPGVLEAVRAAGRHIAYAPDAAVDHGIDPSRLDQAWFRRRAAWQAVSDFLLDPWETAAHAPAAARHLRLVQSAARRAAGIGFFAEAPDGASFAEELLLIRELTIATLHGGASPPAAPPGRAMRLRARLWLAFRQRLKKSAAIVSLVRRVKAMKGKQELLF